MARLPGVEVTRRLDNVTRRSLSLGVTAFHPGSSRCPLWPAGSLLLVDAGTSAKTSAFSGPSHPFSRCWEYLPAPSCPGNCPQPWGTASPQGQPIPLTSVWLMEEGVQFGGPAPPASNVDNSKGPSWLPGSPGVSRGPGSLCNAPRRGQRVPLPSLPSSLLSCVSRDHLARNILHGLSILASVARKVSLRHLLPC